MAAAVQLVCGADDFLVEQKARAVVSAQVPEERRAVGFEVVDGRADTADAAAAAVRQCLEAVRTPALFGGAKLTWLKDAGFLNPLAAPGKRDEVKARVAELTACLQQGLPDGQFLLVTSPSVPRNTAFYKACQAAGEVTEFGAGEKGRGAERAAQERLDEGLAKHGLRMAADVRARFLDRTGTSTRQIVQELEKLAVYLGAANREAQAEDVDAVVSLGREALPWDLLDGVGERNGAKIARALAQLQAQDESGIRLVGMVEGRVRDLLVARQALDLGWLTAGGGWRADLPPEADAWFGRLPKDPRGWPDFVRAKQARHAGNYTLNELRRARHVLIGLREKLVSSGVSPEARLTVALLRIARRRARGGGGPAGVPAAGRGACATSRG